MWQVTPAFETLFLVFVVAFGLVFGSFANVVIYRLPRRESIVRPRSRCPSCGSAIRWYDNIPLVSWFVLGARCRDCGEPISWRYPAVEAASGLLFLLAGVRFGLDLRTPVTCFLFWMLLVLSVIDIDMMRLPNPLVALTAAAGGVLALVSQFADVELAPLVGVARQGALSQPLLAALFGVALGVGSTLLISGMYALLRGKQGLGMGDVKLLGALGPFLAGYVIFAFLVGSLLGTLAVVFGQVAVRVSGRAGAEGQTAGRALRDMVIPFGPFIALGGALAVLVGPEVVAWYVGIIT
ncbi:MAG: A24 family peptidase [Coriobacteriia bacterium]